MPWGDRTGPLGLGPRTGRGLGYCSGFSTPGFLKPGGWGFGWGFGRGWGRGRGWRWWWFGGWGRGWRWRWFFRGLPFFERFFGTPAPEDELKYLQEEAKLLEKELNEIRKRMQEIETKKKEA